MQKKRTNKSVHIEILRLIAIYCVIFNHTNDVGFCYFIHAQDSILFPVYLFMSIADKIAVPIFFMISGALLLRKQESIAQLYKKRVLRILVVIIVSSFGYYIYDCYLYSLDFSLKNCVINMYVSNQSLAFWYMYAYLGILIVLPLLRRLVLSMKNSDYIYLAFIYLIVVGVIPMIQYFFNDGNIFMNGYFTQIFFASQNIVYFIMGHFLENVLGSEKLKDRIYTLKNVIIFLIAGLTAIFITCGMTYYRINLTGLCNETESQMFHNSLILIPSMALYFSIKYAFRNADMKKVINRIIIQLGNCVFGVYILEEALRINTKWVYEMLNPVIHTMPACLVWVAVSVITGLVIVWIIKRIPFVSRYI